MKPEIIDWITKSRDLGIKILSDNIEVSLNGEWMKINADGVIMQKNPKPGAMLLIKDAQNNMLKVQVVGETEKTVTLYILPDESKKDEQVKEVTILKNQLNVVEEL